MTTSATGTDRWAAYDFAPPPADAEEPDSPVLVDYSSGDRIAVVTLNRPHADNAISTEMGARLTEVVETSRSAPPSGSSSSPAPGTGRSPSAVTCVSART